MNVPLNNEIVELWWVTKVVVPLVGILIASVIIPLLLHHLKYKRERAERLIEARKEAYREYFKKIESAVADAGQEYEKFSKETMPQAFLKLLQANNSPEAIVEFTQTVGNIPQKIQQAYQKSVEQITSLQVICSDPLLQMTDEFELKNKEILEKSAAWLGELNQSTQNPDFEAPIAKEMQQLGVEIADLKKRIIRQMRSEIGSDKF